MTTARLFVLVYILSCQNIQTLLFDSVTVKVSVVQYYTPDELPQKFDLLVQSWDDDVEDQVSLLHLWIDKGELLRGLIERLQRDFG